MILLALTLYCRSALADDAVVDPLADVADPALPAEGEEGEVEEPHIPTGTECPHVTELALLETDWSDAVAYECCKDTLTGDGVLDFYSVEYYTCICSVFEYHFTTLGIALEQGTYYDFYCSDLTFLDPGWQTFDCDLV